MSGNGCIRCVGQADLSESDTPPSLRHIRAIHDWEEAVEQSRLEVVSGDPRLDRPADQTGAAAEYRHSMLGCFVGGIEQTLFGNPALLPERVQLHCIELRAFAL